MNSMMLQKFRGLVQKNVHVIVSLGGGGGGGGEGYDNKKNFIVRKYCIYNI